MILVAVGTQLSFERLVRTVDSWAANGESEVVAQVGPSSYVPNNIEAHAFLAPREFEVLLGRADLVVAHCGMGSILSALSHGKPIIVMPRCAAKGEHRNDHQVATAKRFSGHPAVTVAWDEAELLACLDRLADAASGKQLQPIPAKAPRELTDRLRSFLRDGTLCASVDSSRTNMAGRSARLLGNSQIAKPGPSLAFLTSLHPSGDPATVLRVGAGAGDSADVVIVTMTADDHRDARRRVALIERGLSALAPNGVLWIDAPPRWRGAIMANLRAKGMVIGNLTICRVRGASEAQIALTGRAVRFALNRGHLSRRWRPALALLGSIPFGKALLTRFLPEVGFAAFRRGTRPFAWLVDRMEERDVDVALITNWRGENAPYLVFGIGAAETFVAKRGGSQCSGQIAHESAMLEKLGSGLADCGLEVPRLIDSQASETVSTLIERGVPGRPMAALIREGHHRDLAAIAVRLVEWLACWNSRTVRKVELTPELADRLILSPARSLTDSIVSGSAYLDWLSGRATALAGSEVPVVAAHNDLTMANVLGDGGGIRSVVDWEAASLDGLPLTDFHYAVCDAAAAINGGDRLAAFRTCFVEDGATRRLVKQSQAPLREIVGVSPEWLELCVHAGWLNHAANEQARSSSSRVDGSFIAIANLLAASVVDPQTGF